MKTHISKYPPTKEEIKLAVKFLKNGEIVALPTETVYGLAADADNPTAVGKIFSAKNRPKNHPLIIHIDNANKIDYWADLSNPVIKSRAKKLLKKFTPGPITLILPRNKAHGETACSKKKTVAIRIPKNQFFLDIASEFNGIAAPSANLFGKVSPTQAKHVYEDLNQKLPLIIDGGKSNIGLESTIINCCEPIAVLRTGKILPRDIEQCLDTKILIQGRFDNKKLPQVSGSFQSHYSPNKPLYLINEISEIMQISNFNQIKVALLGFRSEITKISNIFQSHLDIIKFYASSNPKVYALELFNNLRKMDSSKADYLIAAIPKHLLKKQQWWAIGERLAKASYKKQ